MAGRWLRNTLACAALGTLACAAAQESTSPDPRAEVARHIPGARADQLRASPIPGVYEYTRGAEIAYVTADGKYALSGDLFELNSNRNVTEEHRRELRAKMIAAVPEDEMLIFSPREPKYTVTVFTDVECAFCRKLHSQIGEYNRLGVRVRYLLYPRTGPNSPAWTKAEQVWCSADRNDALTRAKQGQELKTKPCADNPVARSYALGKDFAIDGTPAIVLPNGDLLPGYVPPDVLVAQLKEAHAP
ncbi:MAG: DsbC family protein [Gammaproteobacteria bacterium]|nr:DsbC family protein [Gammaproteobacteria bacterium]MBV9619994.1 DsbC family protein [Gammaproteobacteria bacterium]